MLLTHGIIHPSGNGKESKILLLLCEMILWCFYFFFVFIFFLFFISFYLFIFIYLFIYFLFFFFFFGGGLICGIEMDEYIIEMVYNIAIPKFYLEIRLYKNKLCHVSVTILIW